jgi:hypothetical protein
LPCPANPPPNPLPNPKQDAVKQHLQVSANTGNFVKNTPKTASFACVDSRDTSPILGTPGGDMAEFIGGLTLYFNQTGVPFAQEVVDSILTEYLDSGKFKRSTRFYFHQARCACASWRWVVLWPACFLPWGLLCAQSHAIRFGIPEISINRI